MEPDQAFQEVHSMFPDTSPDTILSLLVSTNYDITQTIEALLLTEDAPDRPSEEPVVELQPDFLDFEPSIPQDVDPSSPEYDRELQRVIEESLKQSKDPKKKEPFGKRFKEKLRNLFRRRKKLKEVEEEKIDDDDAEVITFHSPNNPN